MVILVPIIILQELEENGTQQALESVPNNSMVDGSKTTDLHVVECVPRQPGNHWKLLLYREL